MRIALFVLAAGLALPAPALAATASVSTTTATTPGNKGPDTIVDVHTLSYVAGPGETNAAVLTLAADGRSVTIRDTGADIVAGAGCTATGGEVRCEPPPRTRPESIFLTVQLGDGDDALVVTGGQRAGVDAGPGDDRVELAGGSASGGDGADVLRSTGGDVTFGGGAGDDVLEGGPGDDSLVGGAGRDRIDGGAGQDLTGWPDETRPVVVDLSRPGPAGPAAEPDDLRDIEGAGGGSGDDVLLGGAGANLLAGGPGSDVVSGRDGADYLDGGPGTDQMSGGAGADELIEGDWVPGGVRDHLNAGAGDDRVYALSPGSVILGGPGDDDLEFFHGARTVDGGPGRDLLSTMEVGPRAIRGGCGSGRDRVEAEDALIPADCETALMGPGQDIPVATRLRLDGSILTVPLAWMCNSARRCRVRVEVRVGETVVGSGERTTRRRGSVAIRLTPAARRRVLSADRVRLRYRSPYVFARSIAVHPPGAGRASGPAGARRAAWRTRRPTAGRSRRRRTCRRTAPSSRRRPRSRRRRAGPASASRGPRRPRSTASRRASAPGRG